MLVHTRTKRNPKRTPKNLNNPSANRNEAPNEPQIVHTFAIKHDSQAFFLQAKAVRKNKYSTVKSALWQSQHQTIGRKYNTQQPALRQDAYSIAISDHEKVEIPYQKYHISTTQGEGFALLRRCYPSPTSISEYQSWHAASTYNDIWRCPQSRWWVRQAPG